MGSQKTEQSGQIQINDGVRPRILVADDSRVIRYSIMKILGTDFDVVQVENGQIAWNRVCQEKDIQALITDIEMPEMDGYELICRIRASDDRRVSELPVITITGTDDDAIKERAFACGATDFITKPLDPIQLRARVQAYARYDQTSRELTEQTLSLEEQAISDPLTGLRSRRYFLQRCEQDLAYALRHGVDLSLIQLDIDGFRKIYQTHGDDLADRLLVWVAKMLYSTARTEDTVARLSGTEFAILTNGTCISDAVRLCERLREAMAGQPFVHNDQSVPLTLSMGVASLVQDRRETADSLLTLARQRLNHARSEGGNRVCMSVLGEKQPAVEEIELAPMVAEADSPAPLGAMAEPEPAAIVDIPALTATMPPNAGAEAPVSASGPKLPIELVSVDRALQLLSQGRVELLLPYLEAIRKQLQPLIEFCESAGSGLEPQRPTAETRFEIEK